MNSSIEYIANFKTSLDPYNGITILSEDLPKDILEFEQNLNAISDKSSLFVLTSTINRTFELSLTNFLR
ncbi:hypothetical protein AS859_08260 [Aliarcobacter cryaerophilus]|uniref:Uncharacterized protein n=1 Tax=Aliarcobacter cryaerophilus TaxID=28198 RepID=A0A1V9VA76_9BACT|nr:hypothetical protein AS859_08260 [Aliarcobacter cryaerophilus]